MTSPSVELCDLVRQLLLAAPDVAAEVGARVYDIAPSDRTYPDITFGPSDFDRDDDLGDLRGRIETLQLDIWTRDQGRLWKCRALVDHVCAALHRVEASLPTHRFIDMTAQGRAFRDPDGITCHGVVTVTAEIGETIS